MKIENFTLRPLHNKRNGISFGYILSVLHCSGTDDLVRQISNLFYIANIIDYDTLKGKEKAITEDYLLGKIFTLTAGKKKIKKVDLRAIIGLEDRGTSDKYLKDTLVKLKLTKRTKFTLKETSSILELWQGGINWCRMEAFAKCELAKRYTNGNMEELELVVTDNKIIGLEEYEHFDYFTPGNAKKIAATFNEDDEEYNEFFEFNFDNNYLYFFFYIYVITSIDFKKDYETSIAGIIKEIVESKVILN